MQKFDVKVDTSRLNIGDDEVERIFGQSKFPACYINAFENVLAIMSQNSQGRVVGQHLRSHTEIIRQLDKAKRESTTVIELTDSSVEFLKFIFGDEIPVPAQIHRFYLQYQEKLESI